MKKYNPPYVDQEEKELIEPIDTVNIKKLKRPSKKEQNEFRDAARKFLKAEAKMNIRIDEAELNKIKKQAEKEGLRYQTFVKSILHKYVTGRLVERE